MLNPVADELEIGGNRGHVFASRRSPEGSVPAAPAVVLVHGIGASHRYLRKLHRLLAESVDTYSIDLPGFDSTPTPDHTLSVADHATYILGAMEQLGVPEFVIVGHSMGTQIAVEAARQQPERISHVVLMGPVVDPKRRTVTQQALALACDCLFFESPSSNFLVFTDYLRCGPSWYLKTLPVMMDYPTEDRITGVNAPVLVVRGSKDPVATSGWARQLAERAPNGELLEVKGSGHVVQHNRAVEVAEAITSFAGFPGLTKTRQAFKA
jgi:pimeloyl-ACP methyl ester carboxylesterase